MVTLLKKLNSTNKQGVFSLLIFFLITNFAAGQNLVSIGLDNPKIINQQNKSSYNLPIFSELTNKYKIISPFIELKKINKNNYQALNIIYYDENLFFKNQYLEQSTDTILNYKLSLRDIQSLTMEYGMGKKIDLKKSNFQIDLKFMIGYQFKDKSTFIEVTNKYSFFVDSSYTFQKSSNYINFGLSSNVEYNQKIGKKIYLYAGIKLKYYFQKSVSSPYVYGIQINNSTILSEIKTNEYKVNNFKSEFAFTPIFGVSYVLN